VLALILTVYLTNFLLHTPESLALLCIPTILAASMLGQRPLTLVAAGETLSLVALSRYLDPGAHPTAIFVAVAAIWITWGSMLAIYLPVDGVIVWWQAYYQRAQTSLEESRDREVALKQALADLAEANLQLGRLNSLAQGLRAEAEEARRAKEQFVANVSHELRTPLNMIIGFSEMMLGAPDTYGEHIPPPLLADLAVVHRNAEHLKDLIDDVLDLSQIEAGQMALAREHVGFAEIVEAATVAVRPLFNSKGLSLETEVVEDLPAVFCDPTRLREVLLNLLGNAGRYTDQGGVHVRVWREGNDLFTSVQDTGRGIASADMSKLFQPFQQLDGSIQRRYGGSGLGLSISKRFIELHGGKIWVESQPGTGASFFFRIPFDIEPPPAGGPGRWLTPDWEFLQRSGPSKAPKPHMRPRLVVWEAKEALQRLLNRYWGDAEIVPVGSLEDAERELARTPSQALLVNDASISGALQCIDSAALPYGTPVMICSVPSSYDSAEALGVSDYLVKPVSREALLGALEKLGLPGKTVLIVDDEPDALQLFRRTLNSAQQGYRVLLARDGREALNAVRQSRPDVMLLDLIMPNMDGFQLLALREQDEALRGIPIIVLSAQDPVGRPVISSVLAVTHRGGLSAHQLLTSMQAISQALSAAHQVGDPALPAGPPG
jgi:signal transduction histidine kinase/CheY-like chemotaxis protein